jgi:hypothetical protein
MRVIFTLKLVLLSIVTFGQAIFFSDPAGGDWGSASTWTCVENCDDAGSIPGANDIAFIIVDPGSRVNINNNFQVGELYVLGDVAGSIGKGGLPVTRTLTINGQLAGLRPDLGGLEAPSVNVFHSSTATQLNITFTGSSAAGPVITKWGHNSPIPRLFFNPGTGSLSVDSVSFSQTLTVQSGTVELNTGQAIASAASGTGTVTVNSGAAFNVQGALHGGSTSTGVAGFTINGTVTAGINSYINSTAFTVGAGATFNCGVTGQSEGWWHDDFGGPTSPQLSGGNVNYNALGNQGVLSTTYLNVSFDGSGTKTIQGTGDFVVNGNLSVIASGVTVTSTNTNEKAVAGNILVNGTWITNYPLVLNGTNPQTISGGGTVNFLGGLEIASDASVTLAKDIVVAGGLTVNDGASLNLASRTLTINGGSITYDGTITANVGGSGGTLSSSGTTAVTGTATSYIFNNLTVTGGTFTAPLDGLELTGNLTVSGGTFVAPAGSMDLLGNLSVSGGTFQANSGAINFLATSDQTISGTVTLNDVIVDNAGATNGVVVSGQLNLGGLLTLAESARFDADGLSGEGVTTLLSSADDPTIDGAIDILPSSATLNGNVTVQRYMSQETADGDVNNRIYRYISSPVAGASVAQIQDDGIPVTGSFTGASTCPGCNGPSMYSYNESVTTDTNGSGSATLDDGFVPFPVSSNTETLQRGRGYAIFVRGNVVGGSNTMWDVRGPVHRGFTNYPVTYTSTGSPADDGWNLIGNPYPSTIDWDAATGWTRNGSVGGTIHMRDHATGLVHTYTVGGASTNQGSRYIPMGQAFWVQTTGASPVLQSDENVKVPGTQAIFYRDDPPSNLLSIKLAREDNPIKDETVVHFRQDATAEGFDFHADAWKWKNIGVFNLSTLSVTGEDLAVNSIPDISCGTRIKLKITDIQPGSYALEFSGFDSFEQPVKVQLTDKYTNKIRVFSVSDNYDFAVTEDPSSYGTDRFEITFLNGEPFPELQAVTEAVDPRCGPGSVELIASGAPEDGGYNWYVSETDDNPVDGQHGSTFVTPELQKSQTFYVAAVDSKGCLGAKVPVKAEVIQFDPIAITEAVSGVLESNYAEGNQWYFNDQPIAGATGQTLIPNESGKYRVESLIQEGCVAVAEYDFLITDIHEQNVANRFRIYPNPLNDFLKFSAPESEKVSDVSLMNSVGAIVGRMNLQQSGGTVSGELDLREAAPGFYVLRIVGEKSGVVTHKIIKN